MSQNAIKKLNGKRVFWCYFTAILSLAVVLFALYILLVQNNIVTYFIENNPEGALFADFNALYDEVIAWEFLALLGLGGLSSQYVGDGVFTIYFLEDSLDLTKVVAQIATWVVVLIFLIFLVVSIVSFIRKKKASYFIHTIFGLIATAAILFLISLTSYLIVDGRDVFDVITFSGSVSDLTDATFAWVTKILTILVAVLAVLFLIITYNLAIYITYTSVSSAIPQSDEEEKEEVKEELKEDDLKVIKAKKNQPISPLADLSIDISEIKVSPDEIPLNVPFKDGTIVCENKKEWKKALLLGLTPITMEEALRRAKVKKAIALVEKKAITAGYLTKDEVKEILTNMMNDEDPGALLKRALNGMSIYDFMMSFALEELDRQYEVLDYNDAKTMIEEEVKKAASDAATSIKEASKPKEEGERPAPWVDTTPPKQTLSGEEVREIIRSELLAVLSELDDYVDSTSVVEEKVVIKEIPVPVGEVKEPAKEKDAGNTVVKVIYEDKEGNVETVEEAVFDATEDKTIVIPAPAASSTPEPIIGNAPSTMATEARTHIGPIIPQPDVRGTEKVVEKGEVVKQSFEEKVVEGDDELKSAYQSLKSLLLSYGLNSRVSSTGDTFRLSKKTYCKITVSGTALKIYLALDPKEYRHSAIPINDASAKEAYKQIPLGFRVKSDLSLRRARDLVVDCMNQNGLTPVDNFVESDYVEELREKLK